MKKLLNLLGFVGLCLTAMAQNKPDAAQYEAQLRKVQQQIEEMKKAHPEIKQAMDDYKRQMPDIQRKIDSIRRVTPGMPEVKLVDVDKHTATPDLNKLIEDQKSREAQLSQMKKAYAEANRTSLPKRNPSSVRQQPASFDQVKKWAADYYRKAEQALGAVLGNELKEMYLDSTKNPGAVGMLMIAAGLPKYTGHYLVCRSIINREPNANAINDLGIFLRYDGDYKRALQCFHLAAKMNDSCVEYKANLGWAYAYFGNFELAKGYFNDILKMRPNYASALDGLSLMAYQDGDKAAIWNNLSRQLLNGSATEGFSGPPAAPMVSFCAGVMTEEEFAKIDRGGNGSSNKNAAYDNPAGADEKMQGEETSLPGADDIDYPSFNDDFPADMTAYSAAGCSEAMSKYNKEMKEDIRRVADMGKLLPRPRKYVDGDGGLVSEPDWGNDPHYLLFHQVHLEFEKRRTRIYAACGKKLESAGKSFSSAYSVIYNAFNQEMQKCGQDEECRNSTDCKCVKEVRCNYMPKLQGALRSYVMTVGDIFSSSLQDMEDESWWYRNASAPLILYIAQKDWNNYVNATKEADIRMGKLLLMQLYQNSAIGFEAAVQQAKALGVEGECVFELKEMPPSRSTPKLKKLKTFAGPCYIQETSIDCGPFSYLDNCDRTRLAIKVSKNKFEYKNEPAKGNAEADVSLFFEKIRSKKFKEDDYYRGGMELHAKGEFNYADKKSGKFGLVDVKASAGAKIKGEVTVDAFEAWDINGRPIKKGFEASGEASVSGKTNINAAIGKDNKDILNQSFNQGFKFNGELTTVYGPDGRFGNYNVSGTAGPAGRK